MTDELSTILVIMGRVRAGRRCPQIANWVMDLARDKQDFRFELVDLRDWSLPVDDEAAIPATGAYAHAHTRAWSEKVAGARGVVIVSPQYNWGYPAALKNALDHLYVEWRGKPLVIVTYGGHGGGKCAEQLRQVADGLKMKAVPEMPAITLPRDVIETGDPQTADDLRPFEAAVRQALDQLSIALTLAS